MLTGRTSVALTVRGSGGRAAAAGTGGRVEIGIDSSTSRFTPHLLLEIGAVLDPLFGSRPGGPRVF